MALSSPLSTPHSLLRPGDVIFTAGRSAVSRGIELGTCGPSHIALVAHVPQAALAAHGKLGMPGKARMPWKSRDLIFESTSLDDVPCAVMGRAVAGVQAHEPREWIGGYDGKVWRMPIARELTPAESHDLTEAALSYLGRPYDAGKAGLSGTRWLKRLLFWRTCDRQGLYCVEFAGLCLAAALRLPKFNPGQMTPRAFVEFLLASEAPYRDVEQLT